MIPFFTISVYKYKVSSIKTECNFYVVVKYKNNIKSISNMHQRNFLTVPKKAQDEPGLHDEIVSLKKILSF